MPSTHNLNPMNCPPTHSLTKLGRYSSSIEAQHAWPRTSSAIMSGREPAIEPWISVRGWSTSRDAYSGCARAPSGSNNRLSRCLSPVSSSRGNRTIPFIGFRARGKHLQHARCLFRQHPALIPCPAGKLQSAPHEGRYRTQLTRRSQILVKG